MRITAGSIQGVLRDIRETLDDMKLIEAAQPDAELSINYLIQVSSLLGAVADKAQKSSVETIKVAYYKQGAKYGDRP